MAEKRESRFLGTAQRYVLTGVLTLVPIGVTWLVFEFFLRQLSRAGTPWVRALSRATDPYAPALAQWMLEPWFQSTLAVLLTMFALYVLGWATTRVIGKRLLRSLDVLMGRIPLAQTIYGSTKKLLAALQEKPRDVQRVVLIEFPSPAMKTVGFVTRVLTDARTGQKLAAVYVPTTPNPTSGYLEIVPLASVISTDWTMNDAMAFVISGGAVSPDHLTYTREDSPASQEGGPGA